MSLTSKNIREDISGSSLRECYFLFKSFSAYLNYVRTALVLKIYSFGIVLPFLLCRVNEGNIVDCVFANCFQQ